MRNLLVLGLLLSGCAASIQNVVFTSFGRADPRGDSEVVETFRSDRTLLMKTAKNPDALVKLKGGREVTMREFAKKQVDATRRVEVLVDTVPAGLELSDKGATVKDGSGVRLLGRFTLLYGGAVPLQTALTDVQVLTQAAEGNVAVVSWRRNSQTTTEGAVGLVLQVSEGELDPARFKSGKVQEL